ncbi:MAG: hypothetical protein Q4C70_09395, partial [Planctomycetia bacterium]|nr:hypothetical protein [Planctomycetia bacterium]
MILSQLRKSNIYTQLLRFSLVISLLVVCTSCTSISSNHTYTTHYPNSASLPAGNTPAFQGSNPSSPSSTVPSSRSAPVFTPPRTTTPSGATPGNATQNTTPSVPKPEPPQGQGTRNTTVVPARAPNAATVSELDLIMGPRTVIARPGSEVILTAGLRDRSGYLRTNQRIDWTISPQSVGHFSRIQERELTNFLVLDFVKPQIISDTQAVTTTSRSEIILDRGTPNLNDDIVVRRGESWVSVSSPREGMTIITARAPKVSGNQVQAQTSRIVWIDAAVKLPESRLLDFGSTYTLTTALRRVSDAQPLDRWRVRYEICNDSTAVFGDGNKMLEVYTNRDGEAKIEMRQPISREEETVVSVQIIRPAEGDFTEPVIVQDSKIHYRWTPNTINITKSMPKEAYIGDVVPAVISVTNLTDQELHNVRIVDLQQPGLVLKGAVPESQDAQDGRQWLVEKLAPHETYTIQLNYRVEQPGAYISFAQVQTQKLGNNLVVECSASLQAGSDTSPFTPEMPKKNLNGNGNPSENQSGNLGENSQNSIPSPTPTFVIDDKNHEKNSVADPFGNTTQPLPPPTDNSKDVYVPHVNTQQSTEKTDEKTTENGSEKDDEKDGGKDGNPSENTNENSGENTNGAGNFPVTPELPAPKLAPKEKPKKATNVYAKSPQRAQVLPKESPNAQITFNIDADAQVSLNQPFRVTITINNHTILPQTNVGILVANSRGLSNQSPSGDIYLIERNIRELPAQKQLRLRMDFMPVLPGDQVIEVKLMLSNGKEYRREARLFVREAENTTTPDVPPAIPPLTPNVQETQSTETPNTGTS